MADLKLYDLPPSPNNMKAHIALNFKELSWESIPIDMEDRSNLVEISSQPRTPILVHGDTVIFDSSAILRYLDANFRDTRPLFSSDYETMGVIERWERHGRGPIATPIATTFGQAFAEQKDADVLAEASRQIHEATASVEEQLGKGDWLVGENMTAADVVIAPFVNYAMVPAEAADSHPIVKFFHDNLHLGEGRDNTRAWVQRVMAYNSK